MKRTPFVTAFLVGALASPALAAGGSGDAAEKILNAMLVPAALLLAALPLAVLLRTTLRFPERAAAVMEERPWLCLLLGAANVLLLAVVVGALGSTPLAFVGALLLLALLVAALLGLAAVATRLGARLFRDEHRGGGVGAFALAWIVISGLSLLPVVGFLALLWLVAGGVGAVLLALYRRKAPPSEAAST